MTPYYDTDSGQVFHGHALDVLKSMPDESVQMCVTSPPYWGLRDYGNDAEIWDDPGGCEHVWGDENYKKSSADTAAGLIDYRGTNPKQNNPREGNEFEASQGQFCQLCGAWRGSLGLEPTPELFIKHMVQIFSEVKRVLRNDGTLWLNMGDSYAHSGACGG